MMCVCVCVLSPAACLVSTSCEAVNNRLAVWFGGLRAA